MKNKDLEFQNGLFEDITKSFLLGLLTEEEYVDEVNRQIKYIIKVKNSTK